MLARRPHLWHVRETFVEFPTLWRWYKHYMSTFSTRLVCNSRGTATQFAGTRGQNRTRVVYNGLSPDEFCRFTEAEVDAWRRRLSPDGGPVVGVVGRIKLVRKGQEVFLEAARRLAERFPAARFVCIGGVYPGNESHAEELGRRIQSAGMADRFWVTGDIDDVGPATAALDIAVMPSVIPEPFGNVVMEAMCLGKPVVASGNGGASEQVEHGVTGLLFPPGDADALADALGQLLEDPARAAAMGAAGKQRFNALFSSEQTYAAIRRLHEELGLV
jgi:glycosyltransferase involved in cell wall biosynthesis